MSATANAAALDGYLRRHDPSYLTEDAVFTDMNSKQQAIGREQVKGMLDWVYSVAFDASFESTSTTISDDRAALEGTLVGRHIGEFAGVPATGRDVRIPMAVIYRFEDGKIAGANIYVAVGAFMAQVTAP